MRRGSASIAANPVLIGAATTLVVLVAVFLAYNANSGLPFVPTYQLPAAVPPAPTLAFGTAGRAGGPRRRPRRGQPRRRQRRAGRRHAGRHRERDRPGRPAQRLGRRAPDAEARD